MAYRIVLENEEGFYKDLTTFDDKDQARLFMSGFAQGRDAQKKYSAGLVSFDTGRGVLDIFFEGFNLGSSEDMKTASAKHGFNEGFTQPLSGKLAVKEA